MVLFVMYPRILTSLVYFIGRDIYATIIFHNFQALFGLITIVKLCIIYSPIPANRQNLQEDHTRASFILVIFCNSRSSIQ